MNASQLAENARGDSVTEELLTESNSGGFLSASYDSLLSYLDEGEQPHYIFSIYSTVLDGGGIGGLHEYLTVTEERIRLTSSEVDSTISFRSIVNVGYSKEELSHYVLSIKCTDTIYNIQLWKGSSGNFDEPELKEAIEYMKSKRDEAISGGQNLGSLSPVEKMEQLREMYEKGLIDDSEFEAKKSEILDEM